MDISSEAGCLTQRWEMRHSFLDYVDSLVEENHPYIDSPWNLATLNPKTELQPCLEMFME